VLWRCWLGGRKGIWPVKKLEWWGVGVERGAEAWREVQTCIRPSWCHCHSLSLASVKSRLVLPFWYQLTRVKGKVFPYSLPSVGPGADPSVQAVSPQVTWSESRHIPSSSLPLLSARPAFTFVAFHQMALPVNSSTHLIPAYYSFYRPWKDERLSWPSWLTCSGWLTHISGHPSAAGRAQDRESSPARDRRSTTVPRHQLPG